MPIAKDTEDWQSMLFGSSSVKKQAEANAGYVDSQSEEVPLEQEPVITYDYEREMKEITRRARKTVSYLSKMILPEDMLNEDYVKDKIEQDIMTLSELYWTRRSNELMKLSIMDSIAKGNTAPRMYDVYNSVTDKINENNKQLLATEDNLRKTYTELKYDIQRKRTEEKEYQEMLANPKKVEIKTLESRQQQSLPDANLTHKGTKSLIEEMKERQRVMMRQPSEAEDVELFAPAQ